MMIHQPQQVETPPHTSAGSHGMGPIDCTLYSNCKCFITLIIFDLLVENRGEFFLKSATFFEKNGTFFLKRAKLPFPFLIDINYKLLYLHSIFLLHI